MFHQTEEYKRLEIFANKLYNDGSCDVRSAAETDIAKSLHNIRKQEEQLRLAIQPKKQKYSFFTKPTINEKELLDKCVAIKCDAECINKHAKMFGMEIFDTNFGKDKDKMLSFAGVAIDFAEDIVKYGRAVGQDLTDIDSYLSSSDLDRDYFIGFYEDQFEQCIEEPDAVLDFVMEDAENEKEVYNKNLPESKNKDDPVI